ncbi:uncharacterized protein LOC106644515 [Copidosoma floridanum]|uniref:uncharacterized protein LOC106644515 n=1 Tax=Copidosoma floridanum TaxID=29053 RepID=UPI0006C9C413|nr:uncharacterized protein LOC106644515 [Copidosoma floridanum]
MSVSKNQWDESLPNNSSSPAGSKTFDGFKISVTFSLGDDHPTAKILQNSNFHRRRSQSEGSCDSYVVGGEITKQVEEKAENKKAVVPRKSRMVPLVENLKKEVKDMRNEIENYEATVGKLKTKLCNVIRLLEMGDD